MSDEEVKIEPHFCVMQLQRDLFAYGEQYVARCRCHDDAWHIMQPKDGPYVCPVSGMKIEIAAQNVNVEH
jgi:hypothetical protein